MLPDAGEFFEIVRGDLVIRRVADLAAAVVDRFAFDLPAAGTENALGIFFLTPPENLVQPMHAPIPERSVAVIEKIAPAARVQLFIEGPESSGTTPELPIKPIGRFF